jgi:amidase
MAIIFPEYESFDGLGLANLVQKKVLSPQEILDAAISRVELYNPKLNAVIYKMYDLARDKIKQGLPEGPFRGVPLLLKDLLADYKGVPINFGSRYAFNNKWVSPVTSELVNRFLQSGMVVFGKTNVPEFGLSPVTEPELFGPTHNPWNLDYASGGSSGGAAVAVAAGILPIAHGGDGGGSLRIPAAYNGVFGFKPSRGRTPTGPLNMKVWQGMVTEHALTRSVRDSAALLDVLSGPELGSQISLPKSDISFLKQLDQPIKSLRIGLIHKPFFAAEVTQEYIEAVEQAGKLCEKLGHKVELARFDVTEEVANAFLLMMIAETASGAKDLMAAIGRKPKSNELEKITATMCHAGDEFSAADYANALHIIDKVGLRLAGFFQKYDVMLTPTMPFPAPKIGGYKPTRNEEWGIKLLRYLPYGSTLRHLVEKASAKNFSFMSFTALFNMGGQPAMSVPLYWDKKGMPIGIQFAANWKQDGLLLQLAHQLEQAQPWADKRPII